MNAPAGEATSSEERERTSEEVASPVTMWSETVQIASAFRPWPAAIV